METTKDRTRKKRATSPRPTKSRRHSHAVREELKRRWRDPEYRAKMEAVLRKAVAERDPSGRLGVPDGMRKAEAMVLWAKAEEQAREFIRIMEDAGKLPEVVVPGSEEEMAKKTLEEAYKYAVSPLTDAKTKVGYQRLVLEYTKAKPEQKSKLTLENSAEWLAALATDMKKDGNSGSQSN